MNIYCPHCDKKQTLSLKEKTDTVSENKELECPGAVTGHIRCVRCKRGIRFNLYPPHTRNLFGFSLDIFKED